MFHTPGVNRYKRLYFLWRPDAGLGRHSDILQMWEEIQDSWDVNSSESGPSVSKAVFPLELLFFLFVKSQ